MIVVSKLVPLNWLSLCPRFGKIRVECDAYDISITEILHFVFCCSALQEAIRFNIVFPLVAQDLTKSLEEFNWESFELRLGTINASLIACQNRGSNIGASLDDGMAESSESSLFPLPYPRGVLRSDPGTSLRRGKRGTYRTDGPGHSMCEEPMWPWDAGSCSLKKAEEAVLEGLSTFPAPCRRSPQREECP